MDKVLSRKDKIILRRDKILEILKEYGALSTDQITEVLNDKFYFHVNRKTVERDIRELIKEGKVKPNPPIGREQTYSLSQMKLPVSEFFINQFWKELNEIRHLNVEDSIEAFMHLRSLIKTYPALHEQIKSSGYNLDFYNLSRVTPVFVENLIGRVAAFLHQECERLREGK